MLDLRYVLDHLDEVRTALSRRGAAAVAALAHIEQLGDERKRAIRELEAISPGAARSRMSAASPA